MAEPRAKTNRPKTARKTDADAEQQAHVRDEVLPESSQWSVLQQSIGNAAVGRLVETKQRASAEDVTPVGPALQGAIEAESKNGRPVDESVAESASETVGGDVSGAVIHTGPAADRMSRAMGAHGFTQGKHVFLSSDRDPDTEQGRETLTHELTHVAEGRATSGSVQRDTKEQLAIATGITVAAGGAGIGGSLIALAMEAASGGKKGAEKTPEPAQKAEPAQKPEPAQEPDKPAEAPKDQGLLNMFDASLIAPTGTLIGHLSSESPDWAAAEPLSRQISATTETLMTTLMAQGREDVTNALRPSYYEMGAVNEGCRASLGMKSTNEELQGATTTLLGLLGTTKSMLDTDATTPPPAPQSEPGTPAPTLPIPKQSEGQQAMFESSIALPVRKLLALFKMSPITKDAWDEADIQSSQAIKVIGSMAASYRSQGKVGIANQLQSCESLLAAIGYQVHVRRDGSGVTETRLVPRATRAQSLFYDARRML